MKNIALILFLLAFTLNGWAGPDRFGFFSDRDVYVSGEPILAKMDFHSEMKTTIIHLDLVNFAGKRITGASIEIKNRQATGSLAIPDSVSTGTYLLCAYHRDQGSTSRMIREIWIANRFTGLEKTEGIRHIQNVETIENNETSEIEITGLTASTSTISPVEAEISISEQLLKNIEGDLLVAVSRVIPEFKSSVFQMVDNDGTNNFTEDKGIVVSGTIVVKKTGLPAAEATVYLTIPDTIPGFQYYITGSDGRFYFLLDQYYGTVQTVIQCYSKDPMQRLKIIPDNIGGITEKLPEFITVPIQEDFRTEITKSIDAVTFQKIFGQEMINQPEIAARKTDAYPYYGIPTNKVNPQLFIDLPNFNEISKELLPGVKFRNNNAEPSLQVFNAPTRNYFNEPPLLLIDGIPVRDLNVIKDMGTDEIDHVEIVQAERYYGDLKFSGVVALYTSKGDYSNLPESDQLLKLKTKAIQVPVELAEPFISDPSVPDLRQVLYWDASAKPTKSMSVKFLTSNVQGTFKMVVRGKTSDGKLFYTEKQFEVK